MAIRVMKTGKIRCDHCKQVLANLEASQQVFDVIEQEKKHIRVSCPCVFSDDEDDDIGELQKQDDEDNKHPVFYTANMLCSDKDCFIRLNKSDLVFMVDGSIHPASKWCGKHQTEKNEINLKNYRKARRKADNKKRKSGK